MDQKSKRLELHAKLMDILGSKHVYFQPPETVKMSYPCIVYRRNTAETQHANNLPYTQRMRYQITVIDPDPDSNIPKNVAALPMCMFDRHFTSNNLNHDIYNLFY